MIQFVLVSITRHLQKVWRDFLSIYYANTPTWRWLKSGALVFFGFFLWAGGSVVRSVKPGWGFLSYVMAYGFLLIAWGPFTHLVVVPVTIRLRRTGEHPIARIFSRHSGKINLSIFFAIVIILGFTTPSLMMLEFSPDTFGDDSVDIEGELVCETGAEEISCYVEDPEGIDHVTVESGGEQIARADEPPFNVTFSTDEVAETRTGPEYQVTFRDEDGNRIRRFVRTVRE